MSLYLCAFDGDIEIAGVVAGAYSTFAKFRDAIAGVAAVTGVNFPIFLDHSDADGAWTVEQLGGLRRELAAMVQDEHVSRAVSSFSTPDEAPLLDALLNLAELASVRKLPIQFQ